MEGKLVNDLTKLANIAEIVGALIVVGGLFFALMQMRQIRQQRRELAAIELFRLERIVEDELSPCDAAIDVVCGFWDE